MSRKVRNISVFVLLNITVFLVIMLSTYI